MDNNSSLDRTVSFQEDVLPDLEPVIEDLKGNARFGPARALLGKARKIFPGNLWIDTQLVLCAYLDTDLSSQERLSQAIGFLDRFEGKIGKKPSEAFSQEDEDRLHRFLADGFFGLGAYRESGQWLARLEVPEISQDNEEQREWREGRQTLTEELGEGRKPSVLEDRGKVGLALSGGGFRASLYHLGVLARLAEMDVLRSVEVLSTVSGGSIVGALYYLRVKRLLEKKTDDKISRQDYIQIVREIQDVFLEGIQENIRVRAFSDFGKNLKMIFSKKYSRSHRLGELYETLLYGQHPHLMRELLIRPQGESPEFRPRHSNWRRRAKVPVLLLNATSLNTGHDWQFTARFMGEPPGLLKSKLNPQKPVEVDKNERYRRVYYHEAPEHLQNYRLGNAVAASACVPGLFPPLPLEGLYPDKVLRLVDGGVHDNQGVAGLLDEGCNFIFCSDASGQMHDQDRPSDSIPAVLARSNSITMDRVREEQYQELRARLGRPEKGGLQGLFFVHLKKDFPRSHANWIGCKDRPAEVKDRLPYNIALSIQKKIAEIRTDLDSFSDVEAFALMASGYLMAEEEAKAIQARFTEFGKPGKWGAFDVNAPRPNEIEPLKEDRDLQGKTWEFLRLEPLLARQYRPSVAQKDLEEQLKVGSSRAFRIWKLNRWLKMGRWVLLAAAIYLLAALLKANWGNSFSFTIGGIAMWVVIALLPAVPNLLSNGLQKISTKFKTFARKFERFLSLVMLFKSARGIAKDILIAFAGFSIAKIHLRTFDQMFLSHGKLSRLLDLKGPRSD